MSCERGCEEDGRVGDGVRGGRSGNDFFERRDLERGDERGDEKGLLAFAG